jgi:hypothetical protein
MRLTTRQFSVRTKGKDPALIVPGSKKRSKITISNAGPDAAFIGFDSFTSFDNGFYLGAGKILNLDFDGSIYAHSIDSNLTWIEHLN